MTRRFQSTRKFDKQFNSLDKNAVKQAAKAIELFMEDPTHPSLRFKKIKGTNSFCEIRVNQSVGIVIEVTSQGSDQINTFFIIGTHDEVFPPK